MYEYRCKLIRVIDGDTVIAQVDLGFRIFHDMRIRLYGIDTPESNEPGGPEATQYVVSWFDRVVDSLVVTQKDKKDGFGRYLGTFYDSNTAGRSLNEDLLINNLATFYKP